MPQPHIVTFEHDIEDEIRAKSASLSDIASASGIVENKPEKSATIWVIIVIIALLILLSGVGTYLYYTKQTGAVATDPDPKKTETTKEFTGITETPAKENPKVPNETRNDNPLSQKTLVQTSLAETVPNIFPYLSKNLIKMESLSGGYIITFTGYNEVYKAVFDNETFLYQDIALLYGQKTASSTSVFEDIRIGELDARRAQTDEGKEVLYTFIKPSLLILGDSKEVLSTVANAILK